MPRKHFDFIEPGLKIDKLTVLGKSDRVGRFGFVMWNVRCDCGNDKIATTDYLKMKHMLSCGCAVHGLIFESRTIHGLDSHKLTPIWRAMISRCGNPNNKDYKYYGERGTTVCERWHDLKNFIENVEPGYKLGLELDKCDNNKGYSPENCRWIIEIQ